MSIGRGRDSHGVSGTPARSNRSRIVGRPSGGGTAGRGKAWSKPSSGTWKLAAMLKMTRPCWIATTRRVVNEPPSRSRSTSYSTGTRGSPARRK